MIFGGEKLFKTKLTENKKARIPKEACFSVRLAGDYRFSNLLVFSPVAFEMTCKIYVPADWSFMSSTVAV